MAEQRSGEFRPAVVTTRTGYAASQAHAKFACVHGSFRTVDND